MPIDSEDMTGKPPTLEEVQGALAVVQKFRVNMTWGMQNPELYVQMGNIARCLELAKNFARPRED